MQSEPTNEEDGPTAPETLTQDVLVEFCGACHGPQAVRDGNVQGGIDYIVDIDRLVDEGWIVPIDSSGSPIIQMMEDGSMPPGGVRPRPSEGEIAFIARFIDNPDYWDIAPRID